MKIILSSDKNSLKNALSSYIYVTLYPKVMIYNIAPPPSPYKSISCFSVVYAR